MGSPAELERGGRGWSLESHIKYTTFMYNIVMHACYLILGVPSVSSPRKTTSSSESVSRHIRGVPRDLLQSDDMATNCQGSAKLVF